MMMSDKINEAGLSKRLRTYGESGDVSDGELLIASAGEIDQQASTIAALKEQLAGARNVALDEAANTVASAKILGMTGPAAITKICAAIRALASQPAAPVQTDHSSLFSLYKAVNDLVAHIGMHGQIDSRHALTDAVMNELHNLDGGTVAKRVEDLVELASMPLFQATRLAVDEFCAKELASHAGAPKPSQVAPPVQQPDDVRDLPRYSPTWERGPDGTSARMELDNAMGQYVKLSDALATTRPGAALTDERILLISRDTFLQEDQDVIAFARAILAASGWAEQVVPDGGAA